MLSPSGVLNDQNKSFLKDYSKLLPVGRMLIKKFLVLKFAISDDSNYLNGQNILVDGSFFMVTKISYNRTLGSQMVFSYILKFHTR